MVEETASRGSGGYHRSLKLGQHFFQGQRDGNSPGRYPREALGTGQKLEKQSGMFLTGKT